ncbi:MAG TPA: LysM peptidoglycan-binding domain-containing protein [Smithellaceae bacterium]|jgi:nucleoid-associated protein YgaU|nr:LysM peptidoglycan-binding domain-containing protein [Smithellaceae bacterium]HPL68236.1 LysM peptidoglycan-binding domain-containing protein [Smithellaceae bacterium]
MAGDEVKKTEEQDPYDVKQYHEVKKGDTLWKIAEKYYGDGNLYKQIFEANRDVLKNPDMIKIGQKLHIP